MKMQTYVVHCGMASAKKTSISGLMYQDTSLWVDVAFSQIHMIIIDILCPMTSELGNTYLKPWLQVAIVVDNGSAINISLVDIGVVAETQDMPRSVQRESSFPECYETRWQCS